MKWQFILSIACLGWVFSPNTNADSSQVSAPEHPEHKEELKEMAPWFLGIGEQRLLRIPGLRKFSLGSTVVRAVRPPGPVRENRGGSGEDHTQNNEEILLKAIRIGIGDIWVWKRDGSSEHRTIHVSPMNSKDLDPKLFRAVSHLNEPEIIYSGKGVTLRGKIRSTREAALLAAILRDFPNQIQDETLLNEDLLRAGLAQLQNWIRSTPYSSRLRAEQIAGSLWLRGSLDRPQEISQITRNAKAIFPLLQVEIDGLPDHAPTVYFRVFLLELKRNQFRNLGLSWPTSIPYSLQVTNGVVRDTFQMDMALQSLEGTGHAKVLSNPELVVRAPGEAELFAGGELPIKMQNRFYSNVTWKNYGLTLRLKVSQVAGERIRLDIFTEVSHLDGSMSQDEIPGFQANRMKTQVDARFGVPLLLSGLLQNGLREEVKGLPFLRNLPVLGALFGSESYMNEESELVAILYPHATPPQSPLKRTEREVRTIPRGEIPPPRNWVSPSDERQLQEDQEYPWNVFR